ncbi:Uncharacterised protein [Chlamydia trachomatis]|nr:Uncharacterised protein [Chlamydia trachomatis]
MVFGVWMIECLIEDVSFYLCILAIPSLIECFFFRCVSEFSFVDFSHFN